MIQGINAARMDPLQSLPMVMQDTMYPEDLPQARSLTVEQLERLTMRSAQAWLDRIVATAPIEVSIVGDIQLDDAMELARNYLASLPRRAPMSPERAASFRAVPPPGAAIGSRRSRSARRPRRRAWSRGSLPRTARPFVKPDCCNWPRGRSRAG